MMTMSKDVSAMRDSREGRSEVRVASNMRMARSGYHIYAAREAPATRPGRGSRPSANVPGTGFDGNMHPRRPRPGSNKIKSPAPALASGRGSFEQGGSPGAMPG